MAVLEERIAVLEAAALLHNPGWAIARLQELVPAFRPADPLTTEPLMSETTVR